MATPSRLPALSLPPDQPLPLARFLRAVIERLDALAGARNPLSRAVTVNDLVALGLARQRGDGALVAPTAEAVELDVAGYEEYAAGEQVSPAAEVLLYDWRERLFRRLNWARRSTFYDSLTLPKTPGMGFRVDPAAPTYPWKDLLGAISIRGVGAADPSYNIYRGGIRGYQFDVNEEVFIEFHLPHDLVPGSDIYLHFHHSLNGTTTAGVSAGTVTGGTLTWGAEVSYSKGHNQAAFSAPFTTTVVSAAHTSTLYQHHITEVQLSAAAPSATQLDTGDLEPDGVILARPFLSANGITVASGQIPAPFLHYVDVHYQSTGIGTKQKAPGFWT